jgi:hypothetical protein
MFTAEEARHLAVRSNKMIATTCEGLLQQAEDAARKGEWSFEVADKVNPVVVSLLQRQGFSVTTKGKGTKISWDF